MGVRWRLTVGARRTWALFDRASRPSARPTSRSSSGSHVAPRALPHGKEADRIRSHVVPRTPAGPSDVRIAGTGGSVNPAVCHRSAPESRAIFCSMESGADTLGERTSGELRRSVDRIQLGYCYGAMTLMTMS